MEPLDDPTGRLTRALTRRRFLGEGGLGVAGMALAAELGRSGMHAGGRVTHHPAKARNVIYLHMAGSPPALDMFDPKPALNRYDGKPCPEEFLEGERFAFIEGHPKLLGSRYPFRKCGEAGVDVVELLPHLGRVVDRLCFVKSMHTDQFNHAPAQLLLHTGAPRLGRPSMGSWVWYGLGSENADLPGFIVMVSGGKVPSAGRSVWGNAFLPTEFQGVQFLTRGEPVPYLADPEGMDRAGRRRSLDALRDLNELRAERHGDPETEARIAQYEMAFRMQVSVPDAVDLAGEPRHVHELYGTTPGQPSFANHCLLARRLVERGVRFVQLYDWGWDLHGTSPKDDLGTQFPKKCREVDRPVAALIEDLARRGLLDETLVVWGGEFGRTPMNEERNGSKFFGRDHHPHCFTMFLAGGGVRAGTVVGETDELGYHIARDPIHVHDLQATILHLLGLDHEKLTYRFLGRDFRLTDVAGRVVPQLLA